MEVRVNMEQDRLNLLIAEVDKLKIEVDKLQQILHRSSNNHQTESSHYEELVNNSVDHYCKLMSEYRKSSKRAQLISFDELKTKHSECETAALEFFQHSRSEIGELYETLEEKLKKYIDFKYDEFSTNVQLSNKEIINAQLEKKFQRGLLIYHNMMANFFAAYKFVEVYCPSLTKYHELSRAAAMKIIENYVKKFDGDSKYEFGADSRAYFLKKLDEEIVVMHRRFSNYTDKCYELSKSDFPYSLRQPIRNFLEGTKNYYNIPSDALEFNLQTMKHEVWLVIFKKEGLGDIGRQAWDFLECTVENIMEHKEQLDKAFPEGNYPDISNITPLVLDEWKTEGK